MIKHVLGVVMIAGSIAGVYFLGLPLLDEVRTVRAQVTDLERLITRRETLNAVGADVVRRYEAIGATELGRIDALIPDRIDNVKLILELQQLAEQYNLTVERIDVAGSATRQLAGRTLNVVSFGANVRGQYSDFVEYLRQIERNQRLIDLRGISFQASADEEGRYVYDITLDTYWMNQE